jgi:hypothetical protein
MFCESNRGPWIGEFLSIQDSDPEIFCTDPDPNSSKNKQKN